MWFSTLTNQPFKNHPFYSQNKIPSNPTQRRNNKHSLSSYFNLTSGYDKIIIFLNGREINTK